MKYSRRPHKIAMEVIPLGSAVFDDVHGAFPYVVQSSICVPDLLVECAPILRQDNFGMGFNHIHGCTHPSFVFVPHNQKITDGSVTVVDQNAHLLSGIPEVDWFSVSPSGSVVLQNFAERGYGHQRCDLLCNSEASAAGSGIEAIANLSDCQGFWGAITRSNFTKVQAAGFASWEIQFSTSNGDIYSIYTGADGQTSLFYSDDDGDTFIRLRSTMQTGGSPYATAGNTTPNSQSDQIDFMVVVLNDIISIVVKGQSSPWSSALKATPDGGETTDSRITPGTLPGAKITQVVILASGFTQFGWAVHPVKFLADATMTSNPHPIGFAWDDSTPPQYFVYAVDTTGGLPKLLNSGDSWTPGFPAGGTVIVTTNPDGAKYAPQFDLEISGTVAGTYQGFEYSNMALALTRVNTFIPAITDQESSSPITLNFATDGPLPTNSADPTNPTPIHYVRERTVYDPDQLLITKSAEIALSYWRGMQLVTNNTGITGFGNIAVTISLGIQGITQSAGGDPTIQRFSGICDSYHLERTSSGEALIVLHCKSRQIQIERTMLKVPPDVDGWYQFAAIRYLLQQSHIADSDMVFYTVDTDGNLLSITPPDDPFTADPADPNPYFLPIGFGSNPWTPVNRQLPVMEFADQIRKLTGFMFVDDGSGAVIYQPSPMLLTPPVGPAIIFQETATQDLPTYGVNPLIPGTDLNEMWSLGLEVSTANVRNRVTLIGIDAYRPEWQPIVKVLQDDASISSPPGMNPYNYVSWPQEFIWVDSRFAIDSFAATTAQQLFAYMRQPEINLSATSWMQPDLDVTEYVQFNDTRGILQSLNLTLMFLENTLSVEGGVSTQRAQMMARYFEPPLLNPGSDPTDPDV